jgi:hypothetical protein
LDSDATICAVYDLRQEGSVRKGMRLARRLLVALCAGALLGLGAVACGGAAHVGGSSSSTASDSAAASAQTEPITTSVIPPGQGLRGDGDADNPNDVDGNGDSDSARVGGPDTDTDNPVPASYRLPDEDDRATFAYGHAPSPAVERTIAGIVERYFAAAAAQAGVTACSLLSQGLARSVAQDYGRAPGPLYLRGGKTCSSVLSMLFRHLHGELAAAVKVLQVRLDGTGAQVVFSSSKMRASDVVLTEQGGSWRIEGLLGRPLP